MEKIYKEFDDYVNKFNMKDPNNLSKYKHSYRVMNLQEKYSRIVGFDDYNIKLAKLIGLLHDIGRFKQYEQYGTFSDLRSIDHADFGAELLIKDGLINRFWNNEDDFSTIEYAIKNHNKFIISKPDNERELCHVNLIRDTDKLDIIYLMGFLKEYNKNYSDEKLSPKIVETVFKHKPVNIKDVNHPNDARVTYFAFAFDINNIEILKELKRNMIRYYEIINHDNIYNEIYNEIINYIDEREKKNVRKKIQSLRG